MEVSSLHLPYLSRPNDRFRQGVVATLVFVLSSQVLPFVAEDRLRALPLEVTLYVFLFVINIDRGLSCSSGRYWVLFHLPSGVENYFKDFLKTLAAGPWE